MESSWGAAAQPGRNDGIRRFTTSSRPSSTYGLGRSLEPLGSFVVCVFVIRDGLEEQKLPQRRQ
jgi:hypothetical protein